MLAPIRAPLANHDTAAASPNVPRLSAPAAVPGLVLGLKGTVWQRALGERVARGRRVWDGLLGGVDAGMAAVEAGCASNDATRTASKSPTVDMAVSSLDEKPRSEECPNDGVKRRWTRSPRNGFLANTLSLTKTEPRLP
ncbi:hypothetical protein FZEAL_8121 [Fusarium zealandicum]|uniref:Uncharacterized protein n=1 Tax=Fusarium zealandicum TaxID=1053134 RepID=A0A8H4UEM9_9HYPO|nr:hypothetical protein FZEAL_8121 [Fusarium zealandicum]